MMTFTDLYIVVDEKATDDFRKASDEEKQCREDDIKNTDIMYSGDENSEKDHELRRQSQASHPEPSIHILPLVLQR